MALIKCPECGRKKVSDTAEACPGCGFRIKAYFEAMRQRREEEQEDPERVAVEAGSPSNEECQPFMVRMAAKKSGKQRRLLIYAAIGVLILIISTCLIMRAARRDCPLTDVKLGMTYDKAISLLEKRGVNYDEYGNEKTGKLISFDQSMAGISGSLAFSTVKQENDYIIKNISWSADIETKAEQKEALGIITDYLSKLYGSDFYDYTVVENIRQGRSWSRLRDKVVSVMFYSSDSSNYTDIWVIWQDKEYTESLSHIEDKWY